MSLKRNLIGKNAPILRTSGRHTWLAFTSEKEREICSIMLRLHADSDDPPYLDPSNLAHMLKKTQDEGYGMPCGKNLQPETLSFNAPVIAQGRVIF